MKAIYVQRPVLCMIIEDDGDSVILEPVDGTEDQRFSVSFDDPNLIIDPTDDEVSKCETVGECWFDDCMRIPCKNAR